DEVFAIVNADVKANDGTTIIKYGTPVQTEVHRQKARGCGRPGEIDLKFVSTQSVDGQLVVLEGGKMKVEGENRKGLAIGLGVGVGLWAWPGLACLAIKGGQATIEEGTTSTSVITVQDITIK
ncbi:MAG: hypothetical protein Q4D23_05300, partial [Bacteroidales bacterium]|nr:hypothetical protein [Bacteroidales bacterium]